MPRFIEQDRDLLPDSLPQFDLGEALVRMSGNRALLHELILEFGDQCRNCDMTLWPLIDAEQFEDAHVMVHSLKGAAGNLVALTLFEKAQALEIAPANRELAEIARQATDFNSALTAVMEDVDTIPQLPDAGPAESRPLDEIIAMEIVDEMLRLCGKRSIKVKRKFADLHAALAGNGLDAELNAVKTAGKALNFKAASEALHRLASKIRDAV
mgnify:FL=1